MFPIDFQEIVLERVVHRDGQNEYSINGSKVRLKDVQELLSAANIGSTGHHSVTPTYATLDQVGPDHDRVFTVGVFLGKEEVAKGQGRSKQEAEQAAAEAGIAAKDW